MWHRFWALCKPERRHWTKLSWNTWHKADAAEQMHDRNLVCVEWLSSPVRKFTGLMEAESSCSKSWAIITCTPGNLALPEMLFHLLLPLTVFDRHDALLKRHNTYIFAMFIIAYLWNLCAICCIKSIPIVEAFLLPYSWNLTYQMPPPPHLSRSTHTILYSCTCAVASALC